LEALLLAARVSLIVTPFLLAGFVAVQVIENRSVYSTLHTRESNADAAPLPPPAIPRTEESEVIDLYGNEVSDAVAKYKVDAAGALYETHSPHTEVPRLAAPKS
jgi:hypothetical protein